MIGHKDLNKPVTKEECMQYLENNIGIIRNNNALYDRYMKTGAMYFSSMNTSFDISDIDAPRGNILDKMGENLHNVLYWVLGMCALYVGGRITYGIAKKGSSKLKDMLIKLSKNKRFLGIALTFFGIFIIGLDLYLDSKNPDSKDAQVYMKQGLDVKNVFGSLNSEISTIAKAEFTVGSLIKKLCLSIMGMLSLTITTIRRILDRSMKKPIVQFGLVLFVLGIYMIFSDKEVMKKV